jgi:hypothetical protein
MQAVSAALSLLSCALAGGISPMKAATAAAMHFIAPLSPEALTFATAQPIPVPEEQREAELWLRFIPREAM